ncbi:MAG: hypothetical protein HRU28_00025 [Rhizobiales bacterium]|nr:hypothetical protein [Hyphomicrobiales bacterium]
MALTRNKPAQTRSGNVYVRPVKAGVIIYTGALVALENGFAIPAKTALNLIADGRSDTLVNNSTGANGDKMVPVERNNVFGFEPSGVTAADIGKMSYMVDDETVAADDGAGTRSPAGKIIDFSDDLVWVQL